MYYQCSFYQARVSSKKVHSVDVIVTEEIRSEQLAELIKQVQAGNEVVLTQQGKPVAKMVAAESSRLALPSIFQIRTFKGHKVLTPNISQADIAEDMFDR